MTLYGKGVEKHKAAAQEWQTRYETDTDALRKQLNHAGAAHAARRAMETLAFSSESAKKAFAQELEQAQLPWDAEHETLTNFDAFSEAYRLRDPAAFLQPNADKIPMLVQPAQVPGTVQLPQCALRHAFGL